MFTCRFSHSLRTGFKDLEAARLLDSPSTLVLAFCSPMYREHPEVLRQLKAAFPRSQVAGCSTSGEIHQDQILDESIALVAVRFEDSRFSIIKLQADQSELSTSVGAAIGAGLNAPDLRGIIVLSEGLRTNGSALAAGLNQVVDASRVVMAGGLAGDGSAFKSTFTVHEGELYNGSVIAIGLYGANLVLTSASRGGWDKFGPEREVTRSAGNVVYEIDGRPALELYKEYLGEKAKDLPASGLLFPLQIRDPDQPGRPLVRTILAVDEKENSLVFAGDVPQGSLGQLMRANFERVIDGAAAAVESAIAPVSEELGDLECLTIAVSCVGRRLVLGNRADEEVEALVAALGAGHKVVGYYSYGELAPGQLGQPCELHNQSMTLMTIGERKAA